MPAGGGCGRALVAGVPALVVSGVTGFLWWFHTFGRCSIRVLCAVRIALSTPKRVGSCCLVLVGRMGFGRSLISPI